MRRRLASLVTAFTALITFVACQPQIITETTTTRVTRDVTESNCDTEDAQIGFQVNVVIPCEVLEEDEEKNEADSIIDPAECNLEPPENDTEINMIGWSFLITDFYAKELEKCNRFDTLKVNTQLLAGADAQEQVRLALSGGGDSPFDIVHGANSQVTEWGAPGWLLPLNDLVDKYWDEYNLADIPQTAWDGVTLNGNIYGVPVVGNTLHTIYRKDIFDELGIEPPETYAEMIAICEGIRSANSDWDMPFGVNLSSARAWELEFFMVLRANGGDYLDADNQPIFNDALGLASVDLMIDLANACIGQEAISMTLNDQEVGVQLGSIPAVKMWASRAANMSDPERTELSDVIAYAPAPRVTADGPRAGSAWNDYYMIPAQTINNPDLIFRVIMEAADEQSQHEAAALGMVTRESAAEFGGPYQSAAVQTIAEGVGNYDNNPAVNIAIKSLEEFLPRVYTGELSAQEALDAAAAAYLEEAAAQGFVDR
ncbi:MAG: extracellular solute-binding protein [Chloroflexota bacterium]